MAWDGWVTFGGVEIINVARTQAYAKKGNLGWFKPQYRDVGTLHLLLGDDPYSAPRQAHDTLPWFDPDDHESLGFYGVYPLNITGLEDSTRSSSVQENLADGGIPGRVRHGTKSIVFNCVLIADDDASADYGMKWLRGVLLAGTNYNGVDDDGSTLRYFYRNPIWGQGNRQDCYDEQLRLLKNVVVNNGPTLTQKHRLSDGGAAWEVQFTAVAGIPFEFGKQDDIIVDWFGGYPHVINVAGGDYTSDGWLYREVTCDPHPYRPVFDPSCDQLLLPPTSPTLSIGCFDPPRSWHRRTFSIPNSYVPRFTDTVPVIRVQARAHEVRDMRIRIWEDPAGGQSIDDFPCDFVADYLISYVPSEAEMVIDGTTQTVTILTDSPARSRRGDSLLFDSRGLPFDWPALTGGLRHRVAVDMTHTQRPPIINFSLVPRAY